MKALIVDDSPLSLKILKDSIEKNGIEVEIAMSGKEMFEKLSKLYEEVGVITLDREMPEQTGEEVAVALKAIARYRDIPIIFISSLSTKTDIEKGLEIGVYDYIIKPIDSYITYLKIKNAIGYYKANLELKQREENIKKMSEILNENYKKIDELNRRLLEKNKILSVLVEKRTEELEQMTHSLISALENANFYNDEITGKHIKRVAEYSELIAQKMGLSERIIKEIKLYAPLHDIGKVGIPDAILKKPGKYTLEEFEKMKSHVVIGHNMIKLSPLSQTAKNIIYYHHEKWDGTGYVTGLKGEDIPIEARIVALADVFDALTTKRDYKEAFSIEKALSIITEGRGTHFDPVLVDLFIENLELVKMIKEINED